MGLVIMILLSNILLGNIAWALRWLSIDATGRDPAWFGPMAAWPIRFAYASVGEAIWVSTLRGLQGCILVQIRVIDGGSRVFVLKLTQIVSDTVKWWLVVSIDLDRLIVVSLSVNCVWYFILEYGSILDSCGIHVIGRFFVLHLDTL